MLLHEKYAHLERPEDLLPLSLQIVRFKIMSQRRKSVRRGEYTQVSISDIQLPDLDANPADVVERKEMLERLTKAIGSLGERCRELMRSETAGEDVSGDTEDHGRGGDQYDLHVGSSLPQESAGGDGRGLGAAQAMKPRRDSKTVGRIRHRHLTPEEQQALFAAALEDQELFDALAKEQALRDLLRDPAAKAELLAVLDTLWRKEAASGGGCNVRWRWVWRRHVWRRWRESWCGKSRAGRRWRRLR